MKKGYALILSLILALSPAFCFAGNVNAEAEETAAEELHPEDKKRGCVCSPFIIGMDRSYFISS